MSDSWSISFFGGVQTVTGANFLLDSGGAKILVDCGLFQGGESAHRKNREPFSYDAASISTLLVTHAHADHIGRIPKLVREGFRGTIYSTEETRALGEIMLADTANILDRAARQEGISPIYERRDVASALSLWKTVDYHEEFEPVAGVKVFQRDAGHILGSTMFELKINGEKIAFTGDLGNSPSPLLPDTETITDADYLVMESVYGDRNHEPREKCREKLTAAIRDTIKRRGALLIPAFSLERTQELLYELNAMIEGGVVPTVPVFLDSPLAIKVTAVYEKSWFRFKPETREEIKQGDNVFHFPRLLLTAKARDSRAIERYPAPKIIIAGSGMSEGGRILSHEKRYLPGQENMILLTGYQAPGTLGRLLAEGERSVTIDGERIPVRAEVRQIYGFSSHKDSNRLIEFVASTAETLKKAFLVMGEPKSSGFLAQRLRDYLGVNAVCPEVGQCILLEF